MRWLVVGSVLLGGLGCTEPESLPLVSGEWGGEHLGLVVTTARADVEFDCATGWITLPITTDRTGRFQIDGVYSPGHGGPIRDGEVLPEHPAIYSGLVRGELMSLSVAVPALSVTLGPYALRRGAPAGVFKCL